MPMRALGVGVATSVVCLRPIHTVRFFLSATAFLIKSQSYSVNSIIDIHTTHSMRCKKTQLHSEKIVLCERTFTTSVTKSKHEK